MKREGRKTKREQSPRRDTGQGRAGPGRVSPHRPSKLPTSGKSGEKNSPREQTMSHRPGTRGFRHAGGGGPGPEKSRSAARGRQRPPGRREGRRKESDSPATRPVCTLTPGEERSPPSEVPPSELPASCGAAGASALRGAGVWWRRKGEQDGKTSRAAAQPRPPLGRADAGRGGQGDFCNGDGPRWRGSGTTAVPARGHNPRAGPRQRAGRGGARTPSAGLTPGAPGDSASQ